MCCCIVFWKICTCSFLQNANYVSDSMMSHIVCLDDDSRILWNRGNVVLMLVYFVTNLTQVHSKCNITIIPFIITVRLCPDMADFSCHSILSFGWSEICLYFSFGAYNKDRYWHLVAVLRTANLKPLFIDSECFQKDIIVYSLR